MEFADNQVITSTENFHLELVGILATIPKLEKNDTDYVYPGGNFAQSSMSLAFAERWCLQLERSGWQNKLKLGDLRTVRLTLVCTNYDRR